MGSTPTGHPREVRLQIEDLIFFRRGEWIRRIRSATSIGANYRAACGARSKAEFIAKLQIAREESDETLYWLEILQETISHDELKFLIKECDELKAILSAALKTSRTKD